MRQADSLYNSMQFSDAYELISTTDHELADHLAHSYMIILNGLYMGMEDYENALQTDERNVRLTRELL